MNQNKKRNLNKCIQSQLAYTLILGALLFSLSMKSSYGFGPGKGNDLKEGGHVVHPHPTPHPIPPPLLRDINPVEYEDGFVLGLRNGGILANRLKQSTIGKNGCSKRSLKDLEKAMLSVTRNIQLPVSDDQTQDFALGFYEGYLKALKTEVKNARRDCKESVYTEGAFPGELYGSLVCNIVQVDIGLLGHLSLDPIYANWANGNQNVVRSCQTSFSLTVESCYEGLSSQLEVALLIQNSCANQIVL